MLQQRFSQADELMKSLPLEVRQHPEIRDLSVHVGFICTAQDAPPIATLERAIADNPDDLEARYRLCAIKMTQDDYTAAMEQLLEIVRRDHGFRDQAGRNGLLAIFSLLGEDDEHVRRCRALLDQTLH
jgi:putative thioredoxin